MYFDVTWCTCTITMRRIREKKLSAWLLFTPSSAENSLEWFIVMCSYRSIREQALRVQAHVGVRMDYQLATPRLAALAQNSSIYKLERFSDHAPLTVNYDIEL